MNTLAESSPPGANGLIYTPWIYGERSPVEDFTIRAGVHNLSLEHTRADLCRAVLEGIALNTRWLLKPFERNLGRQAEAIRVAGGGANADVWCSILADVLGRPIQQVADPIQANVRGAALIGAVGLGLADFADVPDLVTIRREYAPDPVNRSLYDDRFAVFTRLYKQNRGVYRGLNGG